jgi:hypothetical protein
MNAVAAQPFHAALRCENDLPRQLGKLLIITETINWRSLARGGRWGSNRRRRGTTPAERLAGFG